MPVRVKICGITDETALEAAIAASADFIGLVFFPPSPRHLDMERAGRLAGLARGRIDIVALTVDADDTLLRDIAEKVRPDYLQAHGRETPARLDAIAAIVRCPLIKAFRVRAAADIAAAESYVPHIAFPLFDAWVEEAASNGLPGGTGHAFDWSLLADRAADRPFMLAGGLTPDNVAAAIATTGAPMVDVSSGVETAPGVKDEEKIRAFVAAAKDAW